MQNPAKKDEGLEAPAERCPKDGKDPHGMPPIFVPLAEFKPELSENIAALAYWVALPRGPSGPPLKSDCDFLDLVELLPRCVIVDMIGPHEWPIALFGTELVNNFGIDATGINAYEFYAPEEQPHVAKRVATLLARAIPMLTSSRVKNVAGIAVDTEWLFLPLANEDGSITRVLVSTASYETPLDLRDFDMEGTLQGREILKLIYGTYEG